MVDQRKRVVWAPRAKRDLDEIWSYYARIASYQTSRWKLPEFYISDATWGQRSRGSETTPRGSVEVGQAK